nr:hypothetical protein [Tanacetum cinerariifolium]
MASEQSSSGPALHEMTPATISSGLVPEPTSSTSFVPPSRNDWDMLIQPLFDELLSPPPSVDHPTHEVIAPIAEVVSPEHARSTGSPSSTTSFLVTNEEAWDLQGGCWWGEVKEYQEIGKNRIKTRQKREAWRSREKSDAVTVDKESYTEENAERRAKFAKSTKVIEKKEKTRAVLQLRER